MPPIEIIWTYFHKDFYSLPDPPPNSKVPPSPEQDYHPRPPKFWNVVEVYKMTKVVEDWRKIGKKSIFHWDFCMYILEFSQKFQILIGLLPKRSKILSLGFLISFEIIKAFQNSIKIALLFIKISFF